MTDTPQFSVITPVHNPRENDLRVMLETVRSQTFNSFEHCIVDDGSTLPHVAPALRAAAAADPRIRVHTREHQGGIVAASNDALALARGDFLAFVDHDDAIPPDALAEVARTLGGDDEVDYVYTDEDKIDSDGRHFDPFLKPDWSPERFRTQMYTCHLSVVRRTLVDDLGGFREGFDGAQDWDLILRVTEQARRIVHIPKVLYHWRTAPTSAASTTDAKPWAYTAGRHAIADHLVRTGLQATVEDMEGWPGHFCLVPALRDKPPVSIVIPTGGFHRLVYGLDTNLVTNCVRSIVERSTYDNYEIVAVIDDGVSGSTREELTELGARLVPFSRPFNFSDKINVGALHARGDYLLFLNDDMEVLPTRWAESWPKLSGHSSWIESMLMYGLEAGVGCVGAKLYFSDTRLQHVGLACTGAGPGHIYHGFPRDYGGPFNNARLPANYLAVTGACLLTRRDVFERVGGFCLQLPINFNDVDYCFKTYTAGLRTVFTPDAELLHFESSSRDSDVRMVELQFIRNRWGHLMRNDPYYNPQLTGGTPHFFAPPNFGDGRFVSGAGSAPFSRVPA